MPSMILPTSVIGADLWIDQRSTRGPFAELSRVSSNLVYRAAAVPGVESSREFVYHTNKRESHGKPVRTAVLGLNWPLDGSSGILVARDDRIEIELAAVEQDSQTVVLK